MDKNILVTGAYGFLGRYTARYFKSRGYYVVAIGHGVWNKREQKTWGIDDWFSADITLENLAALKTKFDIIVHCAGSGSVAYSIQEPMKDFQRSVQSTLCILEYMRLHNPNAQLVYPPSPAVQGVHSDMPIKEEDPCHPVSPYGVHKKIAEDLCLSYKNHFGLNISIIRFFSIYSNFLRKQLLWDAANKLVESTKKQYSGGKGDETRDWLHVSDAVSLMGIIVEHSDNIPEVINAGSGKRYTVSKTLEILCIALDVDITIVFNSQEREGDPKYYWANIEKAMSLGWEPKVSFEDEIQRYAHWFKEQR